MKWRSVWCRIGVLLIGCSTFLGAFPQPAADTLRVLAIRVQFQSDSDPFTTGDGQFDLSSSADPFQIDPPPHNRSYFQDHLIFLRNYYRKVSRGRLIVEGEVFPREQNAAYQLDHEMGFYNPNTTPEEIDQGIAILFREAVEKADADPEIDFSRYQAIIVFHAGVGRDIALGLDETPRDIPSLYITPQFLQRHLGMEGIPVDNGAVTVRNGILLPETESQEGLQLGLNGMLVANIGSHLGFLDLFDPDDGRSGVGRFALMDAGLFNGDGLLPALPMAWTRILAGWETPETIYLAQQDQFSIPHVLSGQSPRVYRVPINEQEYFLLENRYPGEISLDSLQFVMSEGRSTLATMKEVLLTHFPDEARFSDSTGVLLDIDNPDRGLPGGGVLIWHVDENVIEAKRAENRINDDPEHRGIDLEEADGSQDIGVEFEIISGGAGSELGTALDPWYEGNTAPLFRNEFSAATIPNSRSYYNRANSHIRIFDFSRRDSVMTFRVDLTFFQTRFPRRIEVSRYGRVTGLKAADIDGPAGAGEAELILTTDQNRLLVMNRQGVFPWGADSLEAVQLPPEHPLLSPPALFPLDGGDMGMAVLTTDGLAYGFRFHRATQSVDSLFQFSCPAAITTFPIAWVSPGGEVQIYWGCANGEVYRVMLASGQPPAAEVILSLSGEAVQRLHLAPDGNDAVTPVVITTTGQVFVGSEPQQAVPEGESVFQPVGTSPVTASTAGRFFNLKTGDFLHPEDGYHRFDSPLAAMAVPDPFTGRLQTRYVLAGDNHIRVFNYNFTLEENFPYRVYTPPQPTNFHLSPVAGYFPSATGEPVPGVVVADPAGLLVGVDLSGKLLPDFPLAVGDSLIAHPALLDIDGDGDLELACTTFGGTVYVWDFPSPLDDQHPLLWSQVYGDPLNSNWEGVAPADAPRTPQSLLPEGAVYNWPNPVEEGVTFIRYRLNDEAMVRIRIFDLAGDLVTELEGPGAPFTENEVRWEVQNVQSGVYIARVEAKGQSKTEVRLIKIAVIR